MQVFETCQKRCGHIFRERAPHSELFMELMKVATLKRKVSVAPGLLALQVDAISQAQQCKVPEIFCHILCCHMGAFARWLLRLLCGQAMGWS